MKKKKCWCLQGFQAMPLSWMDNAFTFNRFVFSWTEKVGRWMPLLLWWQLLELKEVGGVCVCVGEWVYRNGRADPSRVMVASHDMFKWRKGEKGQGILFILHKLATSHEEREKNVEGSQYVTKIKPLFPRFWDGFVILKKIF